MAERQNIQQIDERADVNRLFRKAMVQMQNDFQFENNRLNVQKEKADDIAEKIIDNANKYFLVKILSPEITDNEKKKREHKDALITVVKIFLWFQLVILFFLLFGIITMIFVFHGLGNDLELSYINKITSFVSVYITSVVIELIAMLKFIISNVFDTSITGLVEIYKDATSKDLEKQD